MNFKNVRQNVIAIAITAGFVVPQAPAPVFADLSESPRISGGNANYSAGRQNSGNSRVTYNSTANEMSVAKVPDAYSCPLFENRPHSELIAAIDALDKEVKASPECNGSPSAKNIEENGNAIKQSLAALQTIMAAQDPSQVDPNQIEQTMTAALTAAGNLGDVINNNVFLNSKCGRQSMSTGKVLLALNDVISGLAPYALFAVSMNAALAPALPFVIGGTIATSGISALSKMIDQNTLSMTNPDHRKAVLVNTCEFTKVAKKVRFMQLAQSGKIDKITQDLENTVALYNAKFGKPGRELSALLKYRETAQSTISNYEAQSKKDLSEVQNLENQLKVNNDDLMICTLGNEMATWASDGKTFPSSVFLNLKHATEQSDRSAKLQVVSLISLNQSSIKKIKDTAEKSSSEEDALRICAQTSRSWIAGIRQALTMTVSTIRKAKADLEGELSKNGDYRTWKAQYSRIETEKVTIRRVEKAMLELSKDNSIIDRSELSQRMSRLKSGLFGSKTAFAFGKPPVLAWIDHTKKMHDEAISAFLQGLKAIRSGSFSLTRLGRGEVKMIPVLAPVPITYNDPNLIEAAKEMQNLSNINLDQIQLGSREHEIVCQQLESTWLDWSAAIDHLGAIQFFCDMIDPVLDVKIDNSVVTACRGVTQLNGNTFKKSIYKQAQTVLIEKGFRNSASLVSKKLKELQCPLPEVSAMNQ